MSSMPARGLEHQRLESRRDRRVQLDAERLRARDQLLRIGDVGRGDPVHHLRGRVAQHPLGADVEDLDDALGVGGDARKVGAIENCALQGPCLQKHFRVSNLAVQVDELSRMRVLEGHVFTCRSNGLDSSVRQPYDGDRCHTVRCERSRYTRDAAGGVSDCTRAELLAQRPACDRRWPRPQMRYSNASELHLRSSRR